MTITQLNEYLANQQEAVAEETQRASVALSAYAIHQITAKDCESFATMSLDDLEQLYTYIETASDKLQDLLTAIGRVCEARHYQEDIVQDIEEFEEEAE